MAMRIEALTKFPEQSEWAEAWESLLERAGSDDVFCSYQWAKACAEFDCDSQPLILAGYDQERLIGIAPFTRRQVKRGVFKHWRLEFLTLPWADYCDFIVEPEARAEFLGQCLDYLQRDAAQWDELRLENLAECSPGVRLLGELARTRGWRADARETNIGPVLDLEQAESAALDELLEKKGVARKAKTLARKGQLEFKIARQPEEVQALLRDFYRFHTVRYLICGQPSLYDPESEGSLCRLFDLLIEHLSPQGKVCVPALFFNGRPIALYVGFEHRGCLMLYAATFDTGVIGTSPGEILAWEVARYCRASGIKRLDFGIGGEDYKFRFTNTVRRNCELVIHRRMLPAYASAASARARAWAKDRPALWHALRQAKYFCRVGRMETQRTGIKRAAISVLAESCRALKDQVKPGLRLYLNSPALQPERKLISEEPSLLPGLAPGTKLLELRTRDFVPLVLAYRRAFPSWYFKRALEYLREGRRGFLVMEGERLTQMMWISGTDKAGGPAAQPDEFKPASRELWPVKDHAMSLPHSRQLADSLPADSFSKSA
jgi:CelD/BcsL family acetyltransferase involved in cellulose biosynthesis